MSETELGLALFIYCLQNKHVWTRNRVFDAQVSGCNLYIITQISCCVQILKNFAFISIDTAIQLKIQQYKVKTTRVIVLYILATLKNECLNDTIIVFSTFRKITILTDYCM